MKDILTLAFISFAPLYYFYQLDFAYDVKTNRNEKTVFSIVTILTTSTFFAKLLTSEYNDYVYYLLVASIAGPFLDVIMGVYPNTGVLCQTTSLFLFTLGENFDDDDIFGWVGIALVGLSAVAYTAISTLSEKQKTIINNDGIF